MYDRAEEGGDESRNLNSRFIIPLLFLFDSTVVALPAAAALSSCTCCKLGSSLPSSDVDSKRVCGGLPADEGWLMKAEVAFGETRRLEPPRAGAGIDAPYDVGEPPAVLLVGGLVGGKGKDA